jgi:hypothetical protein
VISYRVSRGAFAPRLVFLGLALLALAACGARPSGSGASEEPLDLALVPAPSRPDEAPRRPLSADVVRKTEAETRALFGAPTTLRREPPGEVWQYQSENPRCTLLLFFYPDEPSPRLRVTHAQVLSRVRGQTVDDSDCLAALLKTQPPLAQPKPMS